jgi:hypothetical protein
MVNVVSSTGPSMRATAVPVLVLTLLVGRREREADLPRASGPHHLADHLQRGGHQQDAGRHPTGHVSGGQREHGAAPHSSTPERRTRIDAPRRPVTPRLTRTCHSITASVFSSSTADTSEVGACVRSTIHGGIARLMTGIRSNMIVLSSASTAYGRSASTASIRPAAAAGTAATAGTH